MAQSYCVGIDLGTTFASVAVVQKRNVEVIANSMGKRTTPSCVAFTETERLVGNAADNQAAINPTNTIYNVKRIIGRQYDDVTVQQDIKTWPFTVTQAGGKIKVKAKYKGKEELFSPEEICAMILTHMKETAEEFLNKEITDVVITVPAYFNDFQRRATKDAGTIAGLNVLRIINEPTAVALAYGYQKIIQGEKIVLVFDFGGGTLDVSIVKICNDSEFEVKASAGNTHLGGSDLNERMKKYFLEDLNKKFKCDLSGNPQFVRRLLSACEFAKIVLSKSDIATVNLESVFAGMDYSAKITQSTFVVLCDDLFQSILEPVRKALEIAEIGKDEIDEVILAGGSSRIPKVQHLLSKFFDGKKLNKSVNPDEAIAYGAAVQAAMLRSNGDTINDFLLVDVTSLSLGIDEIGGTMSTIIKRGTPIPAKHTITYTTTRDNQTAVRVGVFEGECSLIKDNTFLGEISLTGITPAPGGMERVDITFSVDADSILNVVIQDQKTGNTSDFLIHNNYGRLSKDELQRMIEVAKKFHEEEERMKEKDKARNHLETYAINLKRDALARETNLSSSDKHLITETCMGVEKWLDKNSQAELEEISQRLEELLLLGSIIEIT